jgi:hypothetical protein
MRPDPVEILHRGYELIRREDDAEAAFRGVAPAPVEMLAGQVWTFREGRAARMVMYSDLEKAFGVAVLLE